MENNNRMKPQEETGFPGALEGTVREGKKLRQGREQHREAWQGE